MMWTKPFGLCFVTFASTVSAGVLNQRSSDSYSLYAYGENIGGLPLYYAHGIAVIANHTPANATDVGQVTFTPGSSGSLVGNPTNGTESDGKRRTSGSFSNQELFIPSANSTDHQVGFTADASSDQVTKKFVWYGHFLLVETDEGDYTSLFYAKENQTQDGAYSLQWNITNEDDGDGEYYAVSIRSIAPSNV
ncbi:uncharacterized protein N7529_007305 [Penicillium soppii]|uniref:uncharacterized protein n=1 Tax=Penicillium soppii TaxID=69789 RepID=UPI002547CD5E|nr:uncharacterized protein N7529_007305 [Penicillium soppii]KAJ5865389.1 hypothetical protein N7529_007305 [Penicillium soppii]